MIVIVTRFIPLSLLTINLKMATVAWKEYCAEYQWLNELQESVDRCTGSRDIPEYC